MKTTTAKLSDAASIYDGWREVTIVADYKADAQKAIKVAQSWVKANGGKAKLKFFISFPRWSSNLDLVFKATLFTKVACPRKRRGPPEQTSRRPSAGRCK